MLPSEFLLGFERKETIKVIILHSAKTIDGDKQVKGFLTKMWGQYHIVDEADENTAYPVLEDSIEPCFEGTPLRGLKFIDLDKINPGSFNPCKELRNK